MPDENQFQILCVCTGNICRSPVAERLLAASLGKTVQVASAGTFGVVGSPIVPPMAARLARVGADPDHFAARRLLASMLRPIDLVLALTREHRGVVVELVPAAVRRSFTLLEFARLLAAIDESSLPDGTPADRLRVATPLAARQRRQSPHGDDVDDPLGGPEAAYQRAFEEIDRAARVITDVVNPQRSG